jgi:hypothetical protein
VDFQAVRRIRIEFRACSGCKVGSTAFQWQWVRWKRPFIRLIPRIRTVAWYIDHLPGWSRHFFHRQFSFSWRIQDRPCRYATRAPLQTVFGTNGRNCMCLRYRFLYPQFFEHHSIRHVADRIQSTVGLSTTHAGTTESESLTYIFPHDFGRNLSEVRKMITANKDEPHDVDGISHSRLKLLPHS